MSMQVPAGLIELQRAVDAADARYRGNTGANAVIALAAWSDASALLSRALTTYAADNKLSRPELEAALRRAAERPTGRDVGRAAHSRPREPRDSDAWVRQPQEPVAPGVGGA